MSFDFPTADDLASLETASNLNRRDSYQSTTSQSSGDALLDARTLCDSPVLGFDDFSESDSDDDDDASSHHTATKAMPWWLDLQPGSDLDVSRARKEYKRQKVLRRTLAIKKSAPLLNETAGPAREIRQRAASTTSHRSMFVGNLSDMDSHSWRQSIYTPTVDDIASFAAVTHTLDIPHASRRMSSINVDATPRVRHLSEASPVKPNQSSPLARARSLRLDRKPSPEPDRSRPLQFSAPTTVAPSPSTSATHLQPPAAHSFLMLEPQPSSARHFFSSRRDSRDLYPRSLTPHDVSTSVGPSARSPRTTPSHSPRLSAACLPAIVGGDEVALSSDLSWDSLTTSDLQTGGTLVVNETIPPGRSLHELRTERPSSRLIDSFRSIIGRRK